MRSRVFILAALLALAAVALVAGVTVAGADQSTPLPGISAPDLLAQMAQADGSVSAISGEISWQNELFGDLSAASSMAQLPAQSPLTSSGSGRIWVSDAGARAESQASGGDQTVVVNKQERTAWVYDSAKNAVKKMMVTGTAPAETPSPAPSATFMTPEAITLYLAQFARFATVEVAGQANVAGRDTYQLRMTPIADDTALGYVQAAIDGETMVPLRLEVYAKGGTTPVLRFGFDSISYDPIDPAVFAFTPPEGAEVTTKTVDGERIRREAGTPGGREPSDAKKAARAELAKHALLTLSEVKAQVPYDLSWARDYDVRPFRWGYVFVNGFPVTAAGKAAFGPLGMDLDGLVLNGTHSLRSGSPAPKMSEASVLLYGDGFGAIALAQTATTPELEKQLQQLQQTSQILGTTTIAGVKAQMVGTPLGGIIVWQQGDTTLIAGGVVPMSDLEAFATAVR